MNFILVQLRVLVFCVCTGQTPAFDGLHNVLLKDASEVYVVVVFISESDFALAQDSELQEPDDRAHLFTLGFGTLVVIPHQWPAPRDRLDVLEVLWPCLLVNPAVDVGDVAILEDESVHTIEDRQSLFSDLVVGFQKIGLGSPTRIEITCVSIGADPGPVRIEMIW